MKDNLHAIVLAGGSGTRLWPLSRKSAPKQFTRLFGKDSLLQSTVKRLLPEFGQDMYYVVNEEHVVLTRSQLQEIGVYSEENLIEEPLSRNTAPAVFLGMLRISEIFKDGIVFVFPSDHFISDNSAFRHAVSRGYELASEGYIVTFGIKPTSPETGYGYIEAGGNTGEDARNIISFREKPDKEDAVRYVSSGKHFWNSGIFAFRLSVMKEEYYNHCPDIPEILTEYLYSEQSLMKEQYGMLPEISFDRAVMEKTEKGIVLPVQFGWSDIGSWKAVYDFSERDNNDNVFDGEVVNNNSRGCLLRANGKMVVLNNLSDLVVVDTDDALFVSDINSAPDIKDKIRELADRNVEQFVSGSTVHRPWGYFVNLAVTDRYKVKRVVLHPGRRISLQKHGNRDERWTVVYGTGKAVVNDKLQVIKKSDSLYVPRNSVHRLENTGDTDLEIIEIQTGEILDEDDIIRIEDDYGRI